GLAMRRAGPIDVGERTWMRAEQKMCSCTAADDHLNALGWAHGAGCPWDRTTCNSISGAGYIGVIEWACENGCPWFAENTWERRWREGIKDIRVGFFFCCDASVFFFFRF